MEKISENRVESDADHNITIQDLPENMTSNRQVEVMASSKRVGVKHNSIVASETLKVQDKAFSSSLIP